MIFTKLTCTIAALIVGLGFVPAAFAQQPIEGKDFKAITPPQKPDSGKKIEVIEFFSYACPHCAEFEPTLQSWVKRKPKDVEYKMVPMVFREQWKAPAKLYYTLEAMGLVDKYHQKVYDAIHKQNKELFTDQAVKDWAKSAGIDATKFNDVYDSFGIDAKLQRSASMGKSYGIQFTPAMAVNGKYWTGPSMVTTPEGGLDSARFFKVIDQLIESERGKAGSKKNA